MTMLIALVAGVYSDAKAEFVARVQVGYLLAAKKFAELEAADDRSFHGATRAQATGNLVSLVVGVAVAVIVGVGVAIPIVNDVIQDSNLTGITATIVGFIPVMLGVLIFVATVGPIMRRT
jgi:VIT1/CCC1 family predicted Fe2+/Mn2+ transporter